MSRSGAWPLIIALALAVPMAACDRGTGGEPGDQDTLAIEVPDEVEDRFEEGARVIGGKVGEALEETGEAIEEAGQRVQEEAGEDVTGDTTRM